MNNVTKQVDTLKVFNTLLSKNSGTDYFKERKIELDINIYDEYAGPFNTYGFNRLSKIDYDLYEKDGMFYLTSAFEQLAITDETKITSEKALNLLNDIKSEHYRNVPYNLPDNTISIYTESVVVFDTNEIWTRANFKKYFYNK